MKKTEVIVDTEFINKLSSDGKRVDNLKKVLDALEYKPVVHTYIANHELDMYGYFEKLVKEGYIKVIDYNDFLKDEYDKELYKEYFIESHNRLRESLENSNSRKHLDKLDIPEKQDVFNYFKAKMSLGDIHIILMASFMKLPVILSDDSDMDILKYIAKDKFSYSDFEIQIHDCVDVLKQIAGLEQINFTKDEIIKILQNAGLNKKKNEIKKVWNETHI